MKKNLYIIFSTILALLLQAGCSKAPSQAPATPKVAATIFPLYDIIKNIAGDKVQVVEILPPGASPHTFELRPQKVTQLQGVKIVFRIGHGLDDWTETIVEALPDVRTVVVDKGIRLIEEDSEKGGGTKEKHNEHEGHSPEDYGTDGVNPHYWLSISNGKLIAKNVADEIIKLDPDNKDYYTANLETYLLKLDAAKKEIESKLLNLTGKKIITFHNAWPYFAEEFGLEIVGSFEPFPGKQPTPRYLEELHRKISENNIRALFSEPQLSNETIKSLAEDMGLKLYVLDPEGGNSYIGLLKYDSDVLVKALSDER